MLYAPKMFSVCRLWSMQYTEHETLETSLEVQLSPLDFTVVRMTLTMK